jgi:hypothetical protein
VTKVRPLWVFLGIVILLVILVVLTQRKTDEVHRTSLIPKSTTKLSLFVPSPFELSMINSEKDIWPRRFGPKQPPQSSDLPLIYSTFMRRHPAQKDELSFFRTLGMTATLGEWDTMRDSLNFRINDPNAVKNPTTLLNWVKKEKCSAYGMDVAFRLVQWEPKMLPNVKDVYAKCDPHSFHTFWFGLVQALESKDKQQITDMREAVVKRRQFLANDSFEFFILTQAFESLDLQLAHKGS